MFHTTCARLDCATPAALWEECYVPVPSGTLCVAHGGADNLADSTVKQQRPKQHISKYLLCQLVLEALLAEACFSGCCKQGILQSHVRDRAKLCEPEPALRLINGPREQV